MKKLAIIPARGGSKRIPRKNCKDFLGKPIISYSIEAALKSNLFDEVMVSTDDDEIAAIARHYGASVPFMRSAETANDYATLSDVVDEVLAKYRQLNINYDNFCCILATAPFLKSEDLVDAYQLLQKSNFKTIRPVTRFSYPIQRAFKLNDDGSVIWFFKEYENSRSQDLEEAYHDAGLFYWGYTDVGLNTSSRGAIVISELRCQDIDSEEDWTLAESKYKTMNF